MPMSESKKHVKPFWVVTTEKANGKIEILAVESLSLSSVQVLEKTAKQHKIPIKHLILKKEDFVPLELHNAQLIEERREHHEFVKEILEKHKAEIQKRQKTLQEAREILEQIKNVAWRKEYAGWGDEYPTSRWRDARFSDLPKEVKELIGRLSAKLAELPLCDKCKVPMKVVQVRDDGCCYFACPQCGARMGEEAEPKP